MAADLAAVISELVRRARRTAPGDLAPLVAGSAAAAGLTDTVIYLSDYGQTRLLPLPYPGMPSRVPLGIEGTLAGRRAAGAADQLADHRRQVRRHAADPTGPAWASRARPDRSSYTSCSVRRSSSNSDESLLL